MSLLKEMIVIVIVCTAIMVLLHTCKEEIAGEVNYISYNTGVTNGN